MFHKKCSLEDTPELCRTSLIVLSNACELIIKLVSLTLYYLAFHFLVVKIDQMCLQTPSRESWGLRNA